MTEEESRIGRPPLPDDEVRDQTLRIRLTKGEKEKAKALGADRIREFINRATVKSPPAQSKQ